VFIVQTNSSTFNSKGNISIAAGTSANVGGLSPTPEPTSFVLLGTCLAGLGGAGALRRWRKVTPVA
jgi:hypothetical protein